MLDPQAIAMLVPECYADFRPLVVESLLEYFRRLPPHRQMELRDAWAGSMTHSYDFLQRLACAIHACPALHKLAQMLARRAELDVALRHTLQQFETVQGPGHPSDLPAAIRELGSFREQYHIEIEPQPLAQGSVATVFACAWKPTPTQSPQPGVIKLLKAGIQQRLTEDLDALVYVADRIDRHVELQVARLAHRELFEDIRRLLLAEINLEREQTHLREAASPGSGRTGIRVPELLPFSTPHMTAMQRIHGRKITDVTVDLSDCGRQALAAQLARGLLKPLLLSDRKAMLFHGDPHAGNLLLCDDGRIAALDWALAGHLSQADRLAMIGVLRAAVCLDARGIAASIAALAQSPPCEERVRRLAESSLDALGARVVPSLSWMLELMDGAARAGVRFPPRLLLFRKAYFTLEGVLHDLQPGFSVEEAMTSWLLEALRLEHSARWFLPLSSRELPSGLSTADLLSIGATLPLQVLRAVLPRWLNMYAATG